MITPRVLANQLIGTRWAIRPRLQDWSSLETGSLVPILHLPSWCPWQPQAPAPEFPQRLPPGEKFLSSKTELRLLLFWNPFGFDVCRSVHNVAGVPIGRSLARRPLAAAGMAARPGDNLRLPPAFRFHLQASSAWMYAHTTGHKTPPVGVQSQGTIVRSSHAQSRHNTGDRILG